MKANAKNNFIKWWIGKDGKMIDDKKWAIQDESGDWWLISGSEFPEKKRKEKNVMTCGTPPTFDFKKYLYRIIFAMILGASLGINVFFIVIHTIR